MSKLFKIIRVCADEVQIGDVIRLNANEFNTVTQVEHKFSDSTCSRPDNVIMHFIDQRSLNWCADEYVFIKDDRNSTSPQHPSSNVSAGITLYLTPEEVSDITNAIDALQNKFAFLTYPGQQTILDLADKIRVEVLREQIPREGNVEYVQTARDLAEHYGTLDNEVAGTFLFPDPECRNIRLVEVSYCNVPARDIPCVVTSFTYSPTDDVPYYVTVALMSKIDWINALQGKLKLPEGWNLEDRKLIFSQERPA